MAWRALLVLLAVLVPAPAAPEEVVARLNQTNVSITTGFTGSEIVVFGAIKREAPPPKGSQLDVVVAISGPSRPAIVRRKQQVLGIWLNGAGVRIESAPSVYMVASSRPLPQAVSDAAARGYRLGVDRAVRLADIPDWVEQPQDYVDALIRLRREQGLYFAEERGVEIQQDTLFDAEIPLPARLIEGRYLARIFLLRGGEVVDVEVASIFVHKVGLERWLYHMAMERSALYGILSLALALGAGWLASTFFRFFFP